MYDLEGYIHCRPSKKGYYTLYEGRAPTNILLSECDVVGLEVIRGDDGKPIRFPTIEEAWNWAKARGKIP